MRWFVLLGLVAAACTRPNPIVCCTSTDDCAALGVEELRPCGDGLACVDNTCSVPSCAADGCAASSPVCELASGLCVGCNDATDCARFSDAQVCNPQTGECAECVENADCPVAEPVCTAGSCTRCSLDSDCATNACGDDGACVPDSDVLSISALGVDTGSCNTAAPCKKISFAASKAGGTRVHIVVSPSTYVETVTIASIAAPKIFIHGGGATVMADPAGSGSVLSITGTSAHLRDLTLVPGTPVDGSVRCTYLANGTFTVERLHVKNSCGTEINGITVMRDVELEAGAGAVAGSSIGILVSGSLTIDRGTIRGGRLGIEANINATLDVTNLLVFGTSDLGLRLPNATGSIKFSTIANVGTATGTGPRAVMCSAGLSVSHSIIWAPGPARPPIEGCPIAGSFAGPTAIAGTPNTDPLFVDAGSNDFRLSSNSPARDLVDSGPAFDFEGQARPQGPRFDIGADEAPP